jgi:hypothetical protein
MITQLSEDSVIGGRTVPKGYCNATLMLGAASAETGKRKQWSNYIKSQSTQDYLQELSLQENCSIVGDPTVHGCASAQPQALHPLIIVIKGGDPYSQGSWVHPQVAIHLLEWLSRSTPFQREKGIQRRLAVKLNGETEVSTPVGSIDLVTSTEIIEIKNVNEWKSALGQVLAYGYFFQAHRKRVYLFGKTNVIPIRHVEDICQQYGVAVTWSSEE